MLKVTNSFSLRTLLMVFVIGGGMGGMLLRTCLSKQPVERYTVLGPVVADKGGTTLPPPSDAVFIGVLQKSSPQPIGSVSICQKQLVGEKTGPVLVRPLVGPTRLHTATYRYTVDLDKQTKVVLVDHMQLHQTAQ